jgi:3-deoxy-D-manno-octulosonate 8-phosphate phosphatase KdsC-like HAD superfamily phosphatase
VDTEVVSSVVDWGGDDVVDVGVVVVVDVDSAVRQIAERLSEAASTMTA